MSAETDLYYFDGSSEAAGRLETIRQFFDNERWTILQWPDASAPPHFRMCVRFVGAAPASPARAPALAYITRALSMRTTSEVELAAAGAIFSSVAPSVRDGTILSLSAIFPSKRRIRFDAGVVPSVTVSDEAGQLDEYVVPLDATDRDIAGLQLIQNLEYSFDVRVEFASLDDKSRYVGDALEEYDSFLTGLPPGWRQEGGDFQIQTRSESSAEHGAFAARINSMSPSSSMKRALSSC